MNIQQLEYIVAVEEYQHFGKAAEHCRVTQPTLSMMIQKLEEELDIKLFDRSVQPVRPTSTGTKIIEQARKVLHQVSLIKDISHEEKHNLSGTFRIAVLPTVAPYLLPRFFPQLLKKYPVIDIRMLEMKTSDSINSLLTNKTDAIIIATHIEHKDLIVYPLYYEEFYGYISNNEAIFKNELIRTSDIDGEHLWLLDEGHCFRDQLVRFCQMDNVKMHQIAYKLGSLETFMRMVESGNGMTFIPELATYQLDDRQKQLVRPFAIPRPTRQLFLITRSDFVRHGLLNLFIKSLKEVIPEEMMALKNTQRLV
ncbi:hydrogen peroxide-inducible genes activator [Coprobacter secundus]|uniref:hydrogen peroxide-inducible genes activator n=1 Tax=Coprobacter secundus TaxID=1501392 RepID=UPI0022E62719|nr:hydrogen peroxide-inducible genes activator [Coprobacter secundus]